MLIEEAVAEEEELKRRSQNSVVTRSPRTKRLFLTAEQETTEPSSGGKREELRVAKGESGSMGVFVSAVADPGHFYVQKVGPKSVELDKLVQEMTGYYDNGVNRQLQAVGADVSPWIYPQWIFFF